MLLSNSFCNLPIQEREPTILNPDQASYLQDLVCEKDFSNLLASQGIDISFLDVIGNDLYNSVVRRDANAGKLIKDFDRTFNRQKKYKGFMVDGIIVDNPKAEMLVFFMTYGVLYRRVYFFSQHRDANFGCPSKRCKLYNSI